MVFKENKFEQQGSVVVLTVVNADHTSSGERSSEGGRYNPRAGEEEVNRELQGHSPIARPRETTTDEKR